MARVWLHSNAILMLQFVLMVLDFLAAMPANTGC